MIIQHNMTMIKVDKSEGGFLGSSKPRGGGDESVTAKLTKQVLTMNDHKPREMDVYQIIKHISTSGDLTLSSSMTTTSCLILAKVVNWNSTLQSQSNLRIMTPITRSRSTTRT